MLSLETPKSVFDHFLRETYGIEKNDFDCVDAAKAAKASGSIWGDFCTAWRKTPEELVQLRNRACFALQVCPRGACMLRGTTLVTAAVFRARTAEARCDGHKCPAQHQS